MLRQINEIMKQRQTTIQFMGYNHNENISDGEFYEMQNMCSDAYPILCRRKARGTVAILTKPNGLHSNNYLAYVDGTGFYYNNILKGSVTDTEKTMISMGAYILIFPDKKYYNTSTGVFGNLENEVTVSNATFTENSISAQGINEGFNNYDGIEISGSTNEGNNKTSVVLNVENGVLTFNENIFTSCTGQTITLKRNVPDMDYVTECFNRIWGCSSKNHEIYASKLGDPFNWNCYEGISTDSYAVTVGSEGDFTGAATQNGNVVFFKEGHIHKIYGNKPSNYQVYDNEALGCIKDGYRSIININGVLFYLSINGIVSYSGSIPEIMSNVFGNVKYINGVAGQINNKYYITLKDTSGSWNMFVYDCNRGIWNKEDGIEASYMRYFNRNLYYIDSNSKKIMTIYGNDTTVIPWYVETGYYTGALCQSNYVSKISISYEMGYDDMLNVYIKYDNSPLWELCRSVIGNGRNNATIYIKPRRCNNFKIKLDGYGDIKILSMIKTLCTGSDKNCQA